MLAWRPAQARGRHDVGGRLGQARAPPRLGLRGRPGARQGLEAGLVAHHGHGRQKVERQRRRGGAERIAQIVERQPRSAPRQHHVGGAADPQPVVAARVGRRALRFARSRQRVVHRGEGGGGALRGQPFQRPAGVAGRAFSGVEGTGRADGRHQVRGQIGQGVQRGQTHGAVAIAVQRGDRERLQRLGALFLGQPAAQHADGRKRHGGVAAGQRLPGHGHGAGVLRSLERRQRRGAGARRPRPTSRTPAAPVPRARRGRAAARPRHRAATGS